MSYNNFQRKIVFILFLLTSTSAVKNADSRAEEYHFKKYNTQRTLAGLIIQRNYNFFKTTIREMASQDSSPVKVHIYDLSKGLARALSQNFIGRQIDGVWHTGIVVYGEEYYFGGLGGIESCPPGGTILGPPDEIIDLGKSEIPRDVFMDYLHELSTSSFRPETYHLLDHNCNTFSNEVAQFLTGKGIPSHITNLPQEILNTPFGAMIKPFVDAMHVEGGHTLFPVGPSNAASGKHGSSNDRKPSNI